jgi:hypothetical protein
MNREFTPASKQSRTVSAIAAVVCTLFVMSGIEGLASHYHAPAVQLATAATDAPRT